MEIVRTNTISELDANDIHCLEYLATNLTLCKNDHTLNCRNCSFYSVDDVCIPTQAQHILSKIKGEKKNDN